MAWDVIYITWQELTGDEGEHITWPRTLTEHADVDEKVSDWAVTLARQRLSATLEPHGYRARWTKNAIGADADDGEHDIEWHRARIRSLADGVEGWAVEAVPQARARVAEIAAAAEAEAREEAAAARRSARRGRRGRCQNSYCGDPNRVVTLRLITDQIGTSGYVCPECADMPMTCEIG